MSITLWTLRSARTLRGFGVFLVFFWVFCFVGSFLSLSSFGEWSFCLWLSFSNLRPLSQALLLWSDCSQLPDLWRILLAVDSQSIWCCRHTFSRRNSKCEWFMRITLPAGLSPELLLTHPWVTHLQGSAPLPQPAYSCTKLLTDTRLLLFTPSLQFKCWLYSTDISFCIQSKNVLFLTCSARKWAGLSRSFMLFFSIVKHRKWPIKILTMHAEMEVMYFLFRKETLLYTLQRIYATQHAWSVSSSNEILLLSTKSAFLSFTLQNPIETCKLCGYLGQCIHWTGCHWKQCLSSSVSSVSQVSRPLFFSMDTWYKY